MLLNFYLKVLSFEILFDYRGYHAIAADSSGKTVYTFEAKEGRLSNNLWCFDIGNGELVQIAIIFPYQQPCAKRWHWLSFTRQQCLGLFGFCGDELTDISQVWSWATKVAGGYIRWREDSHGPEHVWHFHYQQQHTALWRWGGPKVGGAFSSNVWMYDILEMVWSWSDVVVEEGIGSGCMRTVCVLLCLGIWCLCMVVVPTPMIGSMTSFFSLKSRRLNFERGNGCEGAMSRAIAGA